jgi:hypothetical protein
METNKMKPSAKDVEVDTQLRDEATKVLPPAGLPELRRMDFMNSRHAGTLSLVSEGLFLIRVIAESCGDLSVRPSSPEAQRQGKKLIGCIEGEVDAILMLVGSSISFPFYAPS